jgi:hypothetical protein
MPRKKIVFVIVEGPSDDEALGVLLERIFEGSRVHVHIVHGDVTTAPRATYDTILSRVADMVKTFANQTHLRQVHFQQIVHLLDTDGAYIPQSAVTHDPCAERVVYSAAGIQTKNVQAILERNKRKQGCLNRLMRAETCWGVPYQAYYMSCNLDHVLHGRLNLTDQEKERCAIDFAHRYKDDLKGFVDFISASEFSVRGSYSESWKFIQEGLRSVQRHTNFGLCFEQSNGKK